MENFDFTLREETFKAIADMGYETPTPIQGLAIPPLLEKRDVIGQAQTGTGKTVAFGIPMIECVDENELTVQGLVLSPTRELAMQTAGELTKLAKYRPGLRVLAVYGGQPIERQLLPLKRGVQIVVGTPGRVIDHINRGTLDLGAVKFAVLDEADEMLDMGFRDDIETILGKTPEERQTALFSATMPFPIMSLAQKYLKDPAHLRVENQGMTVDAVKQTYIPIRSFHKVELLARLLVRDGITRALVFMNTKLGVEEVVTKLQARGFAAAGLHGDMRQIERDAIIERFKKGTVGILVATDVAARGLDIENVEAVFNYDIPLDVENYVHRVGRTGRAGKDGRAYTFVVGRELSRIWDYRKVTKAAILCEQPPSGDDIRLAEEERLLTSAREKADAEPSERLMETAKKLLEDTPADKAVAALIGLLETEMGDKFEPEIDLHIPEPPKPAPKPQPIDRRGARRPAGPYGRPAYPAANGNNRPYSRPSHPNSPRPYGKPAYPANGENRPYGKPAYPAADSDSRPYGKPAYPAADSDNHPYGKLAYSAADSDNHPYGKPAYPAADSDNHPYGKPAYPAADSDNRPYGKPAYPAADSDSRPYGKPAYPAADNDNRPYGKPAYPAADGDNRPYGKPAYPAADSDNRPYGKPAYPAADSDNRPYGKPAYPAADSDSRPYGKPAYPAADSDNHPYGKPAYPAADSENRPYSKPVFSENGETRTYNKSSSDSANRKGRRGDSERSRDSSASDHAPHRENRFERRRREFGELPPTDTTLGAPTDPAPHRENRFERRRREFGDLPPVDDIPGTPSESAANIKPYRPWENSGHSSRNRRRDGAIDAKDTLPPHHDHSPRKKPRKG